VFYTTGQVYDIENMKHMNSFCAFNFYLITFQQIFSQTEKKLIKKVQIKKDHAGAWSIKWWL